MDEDLKNNKNDVLEETSKKFEDGAKAVGEKIGEMVSIAKVKLEIFALNQKIKECKMKIGDIVYIDKIDNLNNEINDYRDKISKMYSNIENIKNEMEEVKQKGEEKK